MSARHGLAGHRAKGVHLGIAVLAFGTIALASAAPPSAITIYVAPAGDDRWSGVRSEPGRNRSDGPVRTLDRALDLCRQAGPGTRRRILLRGGEYFLDHPVALGPEDSNLTIEAAAGETATLLGGRVIDGWAPDGEHLWAVRLPDVAAGRWDFRMLMVDGSPRPRARLPEHGAFEHLNDFNVFVTDANGPRRTPTDAELTTLRYQNDDLGAWLDAANAELTVYHSWDESLVGVAGIDPVARIVTFSGRASWPPGAFGIHRFVVWNVREGLKAPGQWYLDRTAGRAVYWPLPGEDMSRVRVLAPMTESLIRIEGSADKPATGITVKGLTVAVTNTPLRPGGFGAGLLDGALSLNYTRGCSLIGLTLQNVGGEAIKARNTTGLRIEGCEIHDTGACGITVIGEAGSITNNHVHHAGLIHPSAIGMSVTGPNWTVAHNDVHDTPYSAIVASGDDDRIEGNLVYRAMTELHDGAGIYVTSCRRVTIRGNIVRDISDPGGRRASAYYLDEGAEACLVEGNLALRVPRPTQNHKSTGNTLRNNVFVTDDIAVLAFPRSSGYTADGNIIYSRGPITIRNPDAVAAWSRNILFSATSQIDGVPAEPSDPPPILLPAGETWRRDPLFRDLEHGDLRFRRGSPARALGIATLDLRGCGLIGPKKRVAAARGGEGPFGSTASKR